MEPIIQSVKKLLDTQDEKEVICRKYAYVCLVMKGDAYIPGAIVMAHSIRKTGTKNDIVCMVTPDVSSEGIKQLQIVFDYIHRVDYIEAITKHLRNKKIEGRYGSWKSVAYTKWNLLKLIQYTKVMFMDADLVVIENIDSLFKLQTPAGTFSLSQAKPFSKNGLYNPYKTVRHGYPVDKKEIIKGFKSFLCIGTTLVITPNEKHFDAYVKMVKSMEPFGFERCYNGPDEQSIVWFYHNILNVPWTHINQSYNMIPWKQKDWISKEFNKPQVLHYVSEEKPWISNRKEWPDLEVWWKYADEVENCYADLKGFTCVTG